MNIFLKKNNLLRFFAFYSIIWPCGRDNLRSFSCILPRYVMHVTNDQLSDKFNNGWKENDVSFAFYVNNFTLYLITWKKIHVSFRNLLCTLHQLSDKFNNGWKKIKMAVLLRFFAFFINNLTLLARFILLKFVMHVTNKQFSDKFGKV